MVKKKKLLPPLKRLLLKHRLRWKLLRWKKLRLLTLRLLMLHLLMLRLLTLHLHPLPTNSWYGTKNRLSGRFFYARTKRSIRIMASARRGRVWV